MHILIKTTLSMNDLSTKTKIMNDLSIITMDKKNDGYLNKIEKNPRG